MIVSWLQNINSPPLIVTCSFNYIIVNLIFFSDMTFDRVAAKTSALRYFNRMRRDDLPRDQDFGLVSSSCLQPNASAMRTVLNIPPDTSRLQFIEQAARLYRRSDPQVPPGACGAILLPKIVTPVCSLS